MKERFDIYYAGEIVSNDVYDMVRAGGCPAEVKARFWRESPWSALRGILHRP